MICDMVCYNRPGNFIIFKGCIPQIFIGPFLNTLFQVRSFTYILQKNNS